MNVGLSLFFFFFLEFKFEPEPERDRACPCSVAPGFQALLLKSWALARYHRPELNGCLVISDATPPQPCSVRRCHQTDAASLPLSVRLRVTLLGGGRHNTPARSPHLKLFDNRAFPNLYALRPQFSQTAAALLRPHISVGPAEISVQTLLLLILPSS